MPATMMGVAASSIASNLGGTPRASHGLKTFSFTRKKTGVSAIESVTVMMRTSFWAASRIPQSAGRRDTEQHEGELACVGRQYGEAARAGCPVAGGRTQAHQHGRLHGHQGEGGADHRERMRREQAQVRAHPHPDEEEPQQQSLERFDAGFDVVTVFGVREQHAGEEGTQRHRESGGLHEQRGADHHQQRRGREDLLDAAAAEGLQHEAQQMTAAEDDRRDHQHRLAGAPPRIRRLRGLVRDKQRYEGQQRDHRDVLEEGDGERRAAVSPTELLALPSNCRTNAVGFIASAKPVKSAACQPNPYA